jgi:hypothetical protein
VQPAVAPETATSGLTSAPNGGYPYNDYTTTPVETVTYGLSHVSLETTSNRVAQSPQALQTVKIREIGFEYHIKTRDPSTAEERYDPSILHRALFKYLFSKPNQITKFIENPNFDGEE